MPMLLYDHREALFDRQRRRFAKNSQGDSFGCKISTSISYRHRECKMAYFDLHHGNGWQSSAVFSLILSPVRSLQYTSGDRIIVGHECSKAAVLDVQSSSALFITDYLVNSSSPIVSLATKTYLQTDIDDPDQSGDSSLIDPAKKVAFMLTRDSHIILLDSSSSSSSNKICSRSVNPDESTAILIYILDEKCSVPKLSEQNPLNLSQNSTDGKELHRWKRMSPLLSEKELKLK